MSRASAIRLWVVVPCFNEAQGIEPTLSALRGQSDQGFWAVFVDNASTDGTRAVIEGFIRENDLTTWTVISEPQKGTGAAADTGFCFAVENGATHVARTDADCLPQRDWIEKIKIRFERGADFVAGHIGHRSDEQPVSQLQLLALVALSELMAVVSPWLSHNRGPEFIGPYIMAGGGNLALGADLYCMSGGFPRVSIDRDNDDRELQNRVRRLTPSIEKAREVVVKQSLRRVHHYGMLRTILWYWNRKYHPDVVDIR